MSNILENVQTDPELFITKVLGCESLEAYQKRICREIANYDRVAISACHAVGKTFLLARIVLWFLYCYQNSIVITTAPTERQVKMLLWGEIGSAIKSAKYNLGGEISGTKLTIDDKWYALGFSPKKEAAGDSDSKEQKGSSLQGFHSDYVLCVFDEATGIPHDIWVQIEGLLTSGKVVKFVCIANPTTKNCDFYECFKLPSWRKVHLSCFDSPNLIANGLTSKEALLKEKEILESMPEEERLERIKRYKKPVTHLLAAQWVMEKLLEWQTLEHPLFQSKVLGEFPDVDDSTVIQEDDVKAAQARTILPEKKVKYIGVDVARYGDDKTVFTELTDVVHTRTKATAKKDLMETTGDLINFLKEDYDEEELIVLIDATGVGSGVYDRLVEIQKDREEARKIGLPKKLRVFEIHFGASVKQIQKGKKPTEKEELEQNTYANLKALMFFDLKQALKSTLRIRKDAVYLAELPTIRYKFTSSGKTAIESKDDYKKRTGKPSPDYSDSLALANLGRRFRQLNDYLRKLTK